MKRRSFLKAAVAGIVGTSAVGTLSGCVPRHVRIGSRGYRYWHGDDASNTIFSVPDTPVGELMSAKRGDVIMTTTSYKQIRDFWGELSAPLTITSKATGKVEMKLYPGKRYPVIGLMKRHGKEMLMLCLSGCGKNRRSAGTIALVDQDGVFSGEAFVYQSRHQEYAMPETGYVFNGPSKATLKKHREDVVYLKNGKPEVKEYVYSDLNNQGIPRVKVNRVDAGGARKQVWETSVGTNVRASVGSYHYLKLDKVRDNGSADFVLIEKITKTKF